MSEFRFKIGPGIAISALLIGGTACSGEGVEKSAPAETSTQEPSPYKEKTPKNHNKYAENAPNKHSNDAKNVFITKFDDLGSNSSIIQVYPGPSDSASDRVSNGAFNSGDLLKAECVAEGRTVQSIPPETARQSDLWLRLAGPTEYYATVSYTSVAHPDTLTSQLPVCD